MRDGVRDTFRIGLRVSEDRDSHPCRLPGLADREEGIDTRPREGVWVMNHNEDERSEKAEQCRVPEVGRNESRGVPGK